MSHITCPKCFSKEHYSGYGLAVGAHGLYTICECGVLLEYVPDLEGVDEETAARIQAAAKKALAETWGEKEGAPGEAP